MVGNIARKIPKSLCLGSWPSVEAGGGWDKGKILTVPVQMEGQM